MFQSSKLIDVVKMMLLKSVYDELVAKVNSIDIIGFVLKTEYVQDKSDLQKKIFDADKKIPDASGLVNKTAYNAKIAELESKLPSISGLVTNSALNAIENKML